MKMDSRHRNLKGVSMIEFALGAVVFLIMLFGVMDWAWVFFQHQTLLWRASDAARLAAATRIDDKTAIENMVLCGSTTCSGSYIGFFTGARVDIEHVASADKVDDITSLTRYYAKVTISNYTIRQFTPFVGSTFTGKPIVVMQPMECLDKNGNCWVN